MFSGTLKVSQTARQTALTFTPSARARSIVRPPSLSNTKSLATLCAYTSPNCAFIRYQNSVSRTLPRVLPAPDQTCAADEPVLADRDRPWATRRPFVRCVVFKYVGSTLSSGALRDLVRAPSDQRAGVAGIGRGGQCV